MAKKIDKINSLLKKEEIPSCYYECFVLIEEITNLSKEEQKKLAKDSQENYNSINSLKKVKVKIMKKLGQSIVEYKKNRKSEEELKKNLDYLMSKLEKKPDDEIDIIELMRRDEKEKKDPDLRRLKWVKKKWLNNNPKAWLILEILIYNVIHCNKNKFFKHFNIINTFNN